MVAGTFGVSPSAIWRTVAHRIFPLLIFGSRFRMCSVRNAAIESDLGAQAGDAYLLQLAAVAPLPQPSAPRGRFATFSRSRCRSV